MLYSIILQSIVFCFLVLILHYGLLEGHGGLLEVPGFLHRSMVYFSVEWPMLLGCLTRQVGRQGASGGALTESLAQGLRPLRALIPRSGMGPHVAPHARQTIYRSSVGYNMSIRISP